MPEVTQIAVRIQREKWRDVNDLADELAASFRAGISIADVDTGDFDARYAVKADSNTFLEDQAITGKLTLSDAATAGPSLAITHAGASTTNVSGAIVVASTGTAGGLWVERAVAEVPTDVLVKLRSVGNAANSFAGMAIEYVGNSAALTLAHGGGTSGPFYGLATDRPISIGGGGTTLFNHSVVVNGNVTATNLVGPLTGNATTATLATRSNAVLTSASNYVSPSQSQVSGLLRYGGGSLPTGAVNWSQLSQVSINYLGW